MDWNAPMHALWSFFNPQGSNSAPAAPSSQPSGFTAVSAPVSLHHGVFQAKAEVADPDEVTIKAYPTKHYLEPTKLNEGKPWAAQEIPTGYIDGLAYAKAKAKQVGGLDDETLNQFLPLAIRESRYHNGTAYGNNGVYVDYKTPPPKDLQPIINRSNVLAKIENEAWNSGNFKLSEEFRLKREAEDAKLLADPRWQSRADSYHNVTKYAKDLGLEQSTRQEITRNKETGEFIGKADVYMADNNAPYATKALHVPLALYNKKYGENKKGSGLELTKSFVGSGEAAQIRNDQEAHIGESIYHPKNQELLDYYINRYAHHATNLSRGKK